VPGNAPLRPSHRAGVIAEICIYSYKTLSCHEAQAPPYPFRAAPFIMRNKYLI